MPATPPFLGGRRAAVSLTYDDCLPCHRTEVAPALGARGLHGTFYCPAAAGDLHTHTDAWRAIAATGHELGNHTCFHPCRRKPGADWPDPAYDLASYSRRRIADELRLAGQVLRLVDGRERRSFAATCCHTTVGPDGAQESFLDDLRRYTSVVRSGDAGIHPLAPPAFVLGHRSIDRATAAEILPLLETAIADGGWVILLAHGVGPGTHPSFIASGEHATLIDWIAAHSSALWAGTVTEVADALAHAGAG